MSKPIYGITTRSNAESDMIREAMEANGMLVKVVEGKRLNSVFIQPQTDAQELIFWRTCHANQFSVDEGRLYSKPGFIFP